MRGTFTRASKGLTAEWYPMDYTDCEAVRRQGYFHQVIGDIQKDSYRDSNAGMHSNNPNRSISGMGGNGQNESFLNRSQMSAHNAQVADNGSVLLSPQKAGRRGSIGRHVSR
jgi:hypothetical protein